MKTTCPTCSAKYTVADEKVVGRVAKIKCKKCGATIVVNGNDPSLFGAPASSGYEAPDPGLDESTRAFDNPSNSASAAMGGMGGVDEPWSVNLSDDQQPSMRTDELIAAVRAGQVPADTYVWREGMGDWAAIQDIPELSQQLGYGGAPPPEENEGLGATVMMPEGQRAPQAPAPALFGGAPEPAAASAARRAGAARGGAVDLFAQRSAPEPEADRPRPPAHAGHTGERNENSVLFSLDALKASAGPAKKARADDGIFDLRPATAAPSSNGRAALDDIMNMGGGLMSAPALAPPPLLAPVIEPPPVSAPPPSMPPQSGAAAMPMMMPMGGYPPAETKKGNTGLIVGLVGGVVALAAVGLFFALRSPTPPAATGEQSAATATVAQVAPTSAPAEPAPAAPPEPAAAAPAPEPTAVAAAAQEKEKEKEKEKTPAAAAPAAAAAAAPATGKTPTPEKTAAPAAPPPPAETSAPAASGPGNEFNRGAASSALGAAAGSAKSCKKPDGPTGTGKVKVTFAPSGNVTSAQVQGAPFAGTAVGGCVASAFRGAHVPPFSGDPVTVTKSFTIN